MKQAIPLLITGLVIPSGSLLAQNKNTTTKKTNIIYILADDLGYGDLSCYGQRYFTTPNIDAMAAQGMKFTNHYAGCTVSAPSRASLMTGLHTGHAPIRGNKGERTSQGVFDFSLPSANKTVAEYLKQKDYTTACVGKWGMGGPGTQGEPSKHGFDYFYGHLSQLDAHFYFPQYLWENNKKIELDKQYYSQDLFMEKASGFIKENKDNPFFLYLAVTIPHAELSIPDKYLDDYKEKYVENPYPGNGHYCAQDYPHGAFASMVNKLDSDIGDLRKLLEELGIDKNTLIIFTSDNGPHLEGGADPDFFCSGGGLKGYKRDLYEGGIRIPMIAYWPGTIEGGSVTNHPSAFWDFLPTACDIAGVDSPKGIDGISFLPLITNKGQQKAHEYLYWEFHEQDGKQAVVKGEWKAVRLNAINNPDAPIELYNLSNDLSESNNVASQNPQIVLQMKQMMNDAHTEDAHWPFFEKAGK